MQLCIRKKAKRLVLLILLFVTLVGQAGQIRAARIEGAYGEAAVRETRRVKIETEIIEAARRDGMIIGIMGGTITGIAGGVAVGLLLWLVEKIRERRVLSLESKSQI